MRRKLLLLLVFAVAAVGAMAQTECPRPACEGFGCGRYVDANNDGFCDKGIQPQPAATEQPTEIENVAQPTHTAEKVETALQPKPAKEVKEPVRELPGLLEKELAGEGSTPVESDCDQVDCPGRCGRFIDADGDGFCDHGKLSGKTSNDTLSSGNQDVKAEETCKTDSVYPVITIVAILLALYIVSLILAKRGIWTKITHRKIWNVALTVTCLVSCLLGLLLAIFINYGYRPACYFDLLRWHVDFGIAMTLIAIFHLLWHRNYYKLLFKKNK